MTIGFLGFASRGRTSDRSSNSSDFPIDTLSWWYQAVVLGKFAKLSSRRLRAVADSVCGIGVRSGHESLNLGCAYSVSKLR